MDRYVGLDAHSASCTVAVVGPSGRRLQSQVLETNGKTLVEFVRTVPGTKHLCFEEPFPRGTTPEDAKASGESIHLCGGPGNRRSPHA